MQFEEIERSILAPFPVLRYEFKKHARAKVMKNGHVSLGIDKHYYSVPFQFIGKRVKLLFSRSIVEIYSTTTFIEAGDSSFPLIFIGRNKQIVHD